MAEVPHGWAAYARCQQQLSNRASIDDACWGLEAGLNAILNGKLEAIDTADPDLARTIASASRRYRYGTSLLRRYAPDLTDGDGASPLTGYEARSDLAKLAFRLTSDSYRLLILIGYGEERAELAAAFGLTSVALRARLSRARSEARQLLATEPTPRTRFTASQTRLTPYPPRLAQSRGLTGN